MDMHGARDLFPFFAPFLFNFNTYLLQGFGRFLADLGYRLRSLRFEGFDAILKIVDLCLKICLTACSIIGDNGNNECNN